MIQGCTEPSSTLHPYALPIAAHNITDPIGANANKTISAKTSQYKTHGKCFRERTGGEFTQPWIKHRTNTDYKAAAPQHLSVREKLSQ